MRLGESFRHFSREKFTGSNMMHYAPWVHQQAVMDNQRYYAQYVDELSHYHHRSEAIEEDSEQTGDEMHDTMTSATSGERSSSADLFRLEFAANQWSKLVSNAEGLFNKLIVSNLLPHTEQDQIEQWLCMKQEYEECITSDDTASFQGYAENLRRSLEIIEEVTETDEKTDESGNRMDYQDRSESSSETESLVSEDDEDDEYQSDNSENPDFIEKLEECMNRFKSETDRIIDLKKDEFKETSIPIISSIPQIARNTNDSVPIIKPIAIRNPNTRRNSMLPGSEMSNGLLAFNDNFKLTQNRNIQMDSSNSFQASKFTEIQQNHDTELRNINDEIVIRAQTENSSDFLNDSLRNSDSSEPIKKLKALTKNNKAKQTKVIQMQSDLEGAHKRIEELQSTIEIKERFIAKMIKNSDTKTCMKQKFYNSRMQLAQAESACMYKENGEKSTHKKEIELYKNMAIHYEKRLMDIEMIKQIAGDSARKVLELETSLNSSKKQMDKLKRKLKKEEELKKQLEEEVTEDQKKIRELEDKYNLTASKLKEIQSESEDERTKSRNENTDKHKNLLDVSARISHLDHVLKEKSMDLEKTADTDEKEALRHEIRNLRRTRDSLIDEKCNLDEKFQKEKTLTTMEERKLLECGETIEVIDAMIEHKNEMICGRKMFKEYRKKGERILMEKLAKLSDEEMRNLFYTYFRKVIDLKESSKTLDIRNAKLEADVDHQKWQIHTLSKALKQMKIDADRTVLENHALKKRLQDAEALLNAPKITRQKNKLIIQKTTDSEKKKK